jgi:hypothetical protein
MADEVRVLGAFVVLGLTVWIAVHLLNAEVTKHQPPTVCVVDGGTWNFWSGWSCLLSGR